MTSKGYLLRQMDPVRPFEHMLKVSRQQLIQLIVRGKAIAQTEDEDEEEELRKLQAEMAM